MSDADRGVLVRLERASLYRLLGHALSRPEGLRLDALADAADTLGRALAPAVAEPLAQFAAAARETDVTAVADEYGFLFDRGARCPPYEGAWGDAPQLAGKPALLADIAGFYTAFGPQPGVGQPDVEDHIAAECEFMSVLALKEAHALAEGDEDGLAVIGAAQSRFVGDHLGRWSASFADGLRDASPLPYYRALADLLRAWVAGESERLGAAPSMVCGRAGHDLIQDGETFTCPMIDGPMADVEDTHEEP